MKREEAACVLDAMKLNKNLIAHSTEDESLLVPLGNVEFSGICVKSQRWMNKREAAAE